MKIADMKAPHLRTPTGHGGAVPRFPKCSQLLTRRGGVPSGAAVFIAKGGIEVSTPPSDPEEIDFHGKTFRNS